MTPLSDLNWFQAIQHCQQNAQSYVLVTILVSVGSAPRENGSKMVVTQDSFHDTIGGGHLEFDVIKTARDLLAKGQDEQHIEHYPLSAKLGQCCGGAQRVLFEVFTSHCQTLALFGAGHVAHALVPIISQLPLRILWIDSRDELFTDMELKENVIPCLSEEPEAQIVSLPPSSWVLVMTHDHRLDLSLVKTALQHENIPYVGMIGSAIKAKRFKTRLAHQGFTEQQINRLSSPVGEVSIPGKKPVEVAVSIAAQLIKRLHASDQETDRKKHQRQWQITEELIKS